MCECVICKAVQLVAAVVCGGFDRDNLQLLSFPNPASSMSCIVASQLFRWSSDLIGEVNLNDLQINYLRISN